MPYLQQVSLIVSRLKMLSTLNTKANVKIPCTPEGVHEVLPLEGIHVLVDSIHIILMANLVRKLSLEASLHLLVVEGTHLMVKEIPPNVVYVSQFDGADNVPSNEKDKIEEKYHILAVLQQKGYPKEFIQRKVRKHKRRKEQKRERTEEEPMQTKSIDLPYIQGVSEQLKRTLNKHNIKATFYTKTTFKSLLSKPKDPIPKEDRNNAVYQLNCKDCKAIYVGETKPKLNIRAEENITAIKSVSKRALLEIQS